MFRGGRILVNDAHYVIGGKIEVFGMEESQRNCLHGPPIAVKKLLCLNPMLHMVVAIGE
jgi:hypothetical protein